jgi:hypothetical protein
LTRRLIRLVYRSENAIHAAGARALVHVHDIVTRARRFNSEAGIGGALMFDNAYFMQVLEGPEQTVDDLFERIRRDVRHTNVSLLRRHAVAEPLFLGWSMASFISGSTTNPLLDQHGLRGDWLATISPGEFVTLAAALLEYEPQDA